MGSSLLKKAAQFLAGFTLATARSWPGRLLVGWAFGALNFALPVKRLRQTNSLLAFYHPQPAYPLHILIVPRRAIRSLADLQPADEGFLLDLFRVTQSLVTELDLEERGYRLLVNGGKYQEVPQLHFHLISETGLIPEDETAARSH